MLSIARAWSTHTVEVYTISTRGDRFFHLCGIIDNGTIIIIFNSYNIHVYAQSSYRYVIATDRGFWPFCVTNLYTLLK